MKREIEFRGFIKNNNYEEKVVVNGEIFRGYWCYWNEFGVVVAEETCKDIYLSEHCCYYGMVEKNRVIPETVGQYVGIKDKNGKKVYEGDILKVDRELELWENKTKNETFFGVVEYDEENTRFVTNGKTYKNMPIFIRYNISYEVIGNIFDKESDNGD